MKAVPLHRIAVVIPFTQFLTELGAPVEKGLQQVKIPAQALDDINTYVPSQNFWAFVGNMSRNEDINDLGFRVGKEFGANCVDPNFSKMLSLSPTLYHGLKTTIQLATKTISNSRLWLSYSSRDGNIKFIHKPSFDASNPFLSQMDWFAIMGMIGIVKQFAGGHWQPKCIGLTLASEPTRSIREQLPGTRILQSQGHSYITIEKSLLSLPPLAQKCEVVSTSLQQLPKPTEGVLRDYAGSLKQALKTHVTDRKLNIQMAAEISSTSTRSLQRNLGKCGLTYSDLVDQINFEVASNMLQDPNLNVSDIAHALNFNDASHFTRSFRRIAGVTPRAYRRQNIA